MKSLITLLALSLILVACSSAPADTDTTDTPTQDSVQAPQQNAPDTPKSETKTDAKAAFAAALGTKVEYQATYDIVTTANGKSTTMAMALYTKVASKDSYKFRMDASYSGVESRTYIIDKDMTSCSQMNGAWTCYALDTAEAENPQQAAQEAADDATSTVVADGTMQVAGTTATCYLATNADGSSRYCLKDAVPLYVKTMDEKGATISEMTARSYSKSVAESDFTLPAKASAMPSAAGGTFPTGYDIPEGYDLPSR